MQFCRHISKALIIALEHINDRYEWIGVCPYDWISSHIALGLVVVVIVWVEAGRTVIVEHDFNYL